MNEPARRAPLPEDGAAVPAVADEAILDAPSEQAYDDIVRLACMVCAAPVAMIAFADGEQWFRASVGMAGAPLPASAPLCRLAADAPDGIHVVPDLLAGPGPHAPPESDDGRLLRFQAGAPLRSPEGTVLGTLCVFDHAPRGLSPLQRSALQALARQAGHLLELRRLGQQQHRLLLQRIGVTQQLESRNAELQRRHDDLRRESGLDPLTGLFNRSVFDDLRANTGVMRRLDAIYTLALIDIDHFKRINDRHGHLLGDSALRAMAGIVRDCIREGDIAVRYGGDEFLVVLAATPLATAFEVAERIRAAAAGAALPFPITLSIGLASGNPDTDLPDRVFERADQALYRAKSRGRNRVAADEGASPGTAWGTPKLG